jgi:hypothetical protein
MSFPVFPDAQQDDAESGPQRGGQTSVSPLHRQAAIVIEGADGPVKLSQKRRAVTEPQGAGRVDDPIVLFGFKALGRLFKIGNGFPETALDEVVKTDEFGCLHQNIVISQGFSPGFPFGKHDHGLFPLFGKIKEPAQMETDQGQGASVSHSLGCGGGMLQDMNQIAESLAQNKTQIGQFKACGDEQTVFFPVGFRIHELSGKMIQPHPGRITVAGCQRMTGEIVFNGKGVVSGSCTRGGVNGRHRCLQGFGVILQLYTEKTAFVNAKVSGYGHPCDLIRTYPYEAL